MFALGTLTCPNVSCNGCQAVIDSAGWLSCKRCHINLVSCDNCWGLVNIASCGSRTVQDGEVRGATCEWCGFFVVASGWLSNKPIVPPNDAGDRKVGNVILLPPLLVDSRSGRLLLARLLGVESSLNTSIAATSISNMDFNRHPNNDSMICHTGMCHNRYDARDLKRDHPDDSLTPSSLHYVNNIRTTAMIPPHPSLTPPSKRRYPSIATPNCDSTRKKVEFDAEPIHIHDDDGDDGKESLNASVFAIPNRTQHNIDPPSPKKRQRFIYENSLIINDLQSWYQGILSLADALKHRHAALSYFLTATGTLNMEVIDLLNYTLQNDKTLILNDVIIKSQIKQGISQFFKDYHALVYQKRERREWMVCGLVTSNSATSSSVNKSMVNKGDRLCSKCGSGVPPPHQGLSVESGRPSLPTSSLLESGFETQSTSVTHSL